MHLNSHLLRLLRHPPLQPQVSYAKGWGKIKSPTEVEVTAEDGTTSTISGKNIIIATGSEVTPLPGSPVDEET